MKVRNQAEVDRTLKWVQYLFRFLEAVSKPLAAKFAAYWFFKPLRYDAPRKEVAAANEAQKFTLMVTGVPIQAYAWGEGPAVAFIHGWSGRGTQCREFIEPITEAGFTLVAVDAEGHGGSPGKVSDITRFSGAVKAISEHYNGQLAGAIGHSLGGAAILLAIKEGLHVPRAVVISTPSIATDILSEFLQRVGGSPQTGEYVNQLIKKRHGHTLEEFSAYQSAKELPAVPVLLAYDRTDTDVPFYHVQPLLDTLKDARLLTTEGYSHTRILRSPEVIKETVAFLSI
jgi:pimeloyl-ACP methyl ester carboxylesterase